MGHASNWTLRIAKAAGAAALLQALSLNTPALADPVASSYAALGQETSMPFGWMDFCNRMPRECRPAGPALDADVSKPRAWRTLDRINRQVNARVEAVTDLEQFGVEEYWTYPTNNRGDCEEYVLEKRRLLIAAGFPVQSLLITVVRDENNEGHAVLTVKTTSGEYALDNKRDDIRPWYATGYRYVKRQSQEDPNVWLEIGPAQRAVAATSAPRVR